MKRAFFLFFLLVLVVAPQLSAARKIGFGADAFNRAYPMSFMRNAVFSPYSFEVDCVILGEAMDTVRRASVCETLGVMTDFESVYQPIFADYAAMRTNGFHFISARGFCVPEVPAAEPNFREMLMRDYGAAVCQLFPSGGTEAWFRTTMEGEMDDFVLPLDKGFGDRYSFHDLVSLAVAWAEPFPTNNTRRLPFCVGGGKTADLEFMADVRKVDLCETKEYALLRLPLKAGADFYALLPHAEVALGEVRPDFSSLEIGNLLLATKSVTQEGAYHGVAAVVLPKMCLRSRTNLNAALVYFKVPTSDLTKAGARTLRDFVQETRFCLTEQGVDDCPIAEKPAEEQVRLGKDAKKLVFNRPFLFFIHHVATDTIPIVGIFAGKE